MCLFWKRRGERRKLELVVVLFGKGCTAWRGEKPIDLDPQAVQSMQCIYVVVSSTAKLRYQCEHSKDPEMLVEMY